MVHGPAVCEHCITTAQLLAGRKPKKDPLSEAELAALFKAVKEWESWLDACEISAPEGFITAKRTGEQLRQLHNSVLCASDEPFISCTVKNDLQAFAVFAGAAKAKDAISDGQTAPEKEDGKHDDGLVYESYDPLRLKQNEGQELLPFPAFDAALDEFYAKVSAWCPQRLNDIQMLIRR